MGDLDGDGDPEIVVSSSSSRYTVHVNKGGYYGDTFDIPGQRPKNIVLRDIDGDSDLDILGLVNNSTFQILQNLGDLTFAEAVIYDFDGSPCDLEFADLNGDGQDELIVVNESAPYLGLFPVFMDGSLGDEQRIQTGEGSVGVAVADFDQDGDLDLVVAGRNDQLNVLINDGKGVFTDLEHHPVGFDTKMVRYGDLDADGDLDLVACYEDEYPATGGVRVFYNDGSAHFSAQPAFATGMGMSAIELGDLDLDGDLDLAVANLIERTVTVLFNNGTGEFGAQQTIIVDERPIKIVFSDVNLDGVPEIATHCFGASVIVVSFSDEDMDFYSEQRLDSPSGPAGLCVQDLNNDQFPDIAVSHHFSSDVRVFFADSEGGFHNALSYPVGGEPFHVSAGDLNGDGLPDLLTSNTDGFPTVSILLNNGDSGFIRFDEFILERRAYWTELADIDGDSDIDLITATNHSLGMLIYTNNGDATFQHTITIDTKGRRPWYCRALDLEDDGDQDILVAYAFESSMELFRNDGDGVFASAGYYSLPAEVRRFELSDIEGDGDQDLILILGNEFGVMHNLGNSTFGPYMRHGPEGSRASSLAMGDIDADGDEDALLGMVGGSVSRVMTNDGDGNFELFMQHTGDRPTGDVSLADLDLDQDLDIVVCLKDRNEVAIMRNTTANQGCLADLNGDGVLNFFDVSAFLVAFNAQQPDADLNMDGSFNFFDVSTFLVAFNEGCP